MTVLPQPNSITQSSDLASETHVAWNFIRRNSDGRCEPSTLSIVADSHGSIVASVTTALGHSVLDVLATEFEQFTTSNDDLVRSWLLNGNRILRVAIDSTGHIIAVRSDLPKIMHLPGGTYSLRREPTE